MARRRASGGRIQISARISSELKSRIESYAKSRDISFNQAVVELLEAGLRVGVGSGGSALDIARTLRYMAAVLGHTAASAFNAFCVLSGILRSMGRDYEGFNTLFNIAHNAIRAANALERRLGVDKSNEHFAIINELIKDEAAREGG